MKLKKQQSFKGLLLILCFQWFFQLTAQDQVWSEVNKTYPEKFFSRYATASYFGSSVVIDGDYMVVGEYGGYNLNSEETGVSNVYYFNGSEWEHQAVLYASDGAKYDDFGRYGLAIYDDLIVVGASGDDDNGDSSGSAYVFEKPDGGWANMTETVKLIPDDGYTRDYFGNSIAISNEVIAVGSYGDGDGSVYIYEKPADGWNTLTNETTKLVASDGTSDDYFGSSVSMFEDVLVVGASGEDIDDLSSSGAVYVFEKPESGWTDGTVEIAKLTPSDPGESDVFGYSVSVSGDVIVVGAYQDDVNDVETGSAYVFEKPDAGWVDMSETGKLTASDGEDDDEFGVRVDIEGNIITIGAWKEDDKGSSAGAVYLYEQPESGWGDMSETLKLLADDGSSSDYFGSSVAISDDKITVGAYNNGSSGSAYIYDKPDDGWLNLNQSNYAKVESENMATNALNVLYGTSVDIDGDYAVVGAPGELDDDGSVYVLEFDGNTWQNIARLTTSQGQDGYGYGGSVSISGDVVVVGEAQVYESTGIAYVFEKPAGGWADMTETAILTASDGQVDDRFGASVDVSNSIIVIGAYRDDVYTGSAYVFEKPDGGWINMTETAKLTSSSREEYDYFGEHVSIDGDRIVIGSDGEDNVGNNSGSVYVFEKPEDTGWVNMTETANLRSSDEGDDQDFGWDVAIREDILVVGAAGEDEGGSAYVFEFSDGVGFVQVAKLTPSDTQDEYSSFGNSVSVQGDLIVVGSYSDDDVVYGDNAGSVYIYEKPESGWTDMTETTKLIGSDSWNYFGEEVAISDGMILVGAPRNDDVDDYAGVAHFYTLKDEQTITFSELSEVTYGEADFDLSATASSNLTVTYSSSDETVATIDGSKLSIVGSGVTTITASQSGDIEFAPAEDVVQELTVNMANQTITFAALDAVVYGDEPFLLAASASSELAVSYESSNTDVATIDGSTVTIVGVGTTTITASQAGNENYNAALDQDQVLTVDKGDQTISFAALANRGYGEADFGLTATATSELEITYSSSDEAIATINGSTVTIVGVGTTTITASQTGNDNYNEAAPVAQDLIVEKGEMSFSFSSIPEKTYDDEPFNLVITEGESGNDVSISIEDESIATISGNTVTILKVGTTSITASQLGNDNYNDVSVTHQLVINKADQTIDFAEISDVDLAETNTVNLTATSSSGSDISFAITQGADIASISNGVVTLTGKGTVTIEASQAGDDNYNAASATQSFTVADSRLLAQEITFGTLSSKTYGDASFALTATASSGLTVTYASSDQTVATVAGSTVTILQAGSTTITASQGGNEEYDVAPDVTQELVVSKATLNVIADDKTITYGEALPEFTLTYEDFIGDDGTDDLTTLPTATTTAVAGSDADEYTIQVEGGFATNYDFTYETGTLTIAKADQTITFAEISDVDLAEATQVNLTATASSGLEVSYEITQGTDIASISNGVITLTNTGTVTIEATQPGDDNYNEATSISRSFNATDSRKSDQTITFTSLDSKIYGDASFDLTATASSGLTVTYSSSNEAVATISGSTVTIVGVGTTTITASQGGDADFNPATQVTQDLTVGKASLTITADDQEMTVGETLPELTMSFTGFVNNEEAEDITPPSISTTATGETVGTFEIELSDDGSADNYELTLVNGTLTVKEEEVLSVIMDNAIMVYPNPVSDWLTIADKQVNKVEVYSLEGSLVQTMAITSGKVNISELQEGSYVLKLLDERGELLSTNRLLKR